MFFETRKHKDLYVWLGKMPTGPTVKFHVTNGEGWAAGVRRRARTRRARALGHWRKGVPGTAVLSTRA